MHICTHMYPHTSIHTCTHKYHLYTHAHTDIYTHHAHIYIFMHMLTSIHTCIHIHLYTHTYIYTYTHTCIHTHLHAHTFLYTCTHLHPYTHAYECTQMYQYIHAQIQTIQRHNWEEKGVMLPEKLLNQGSPKWRHSSFAWKRSARPSHTAQKPYCWELHLNGSNSSDSGITSPLLTCLKCMGSQHVKCLQMCWNQPSFKKPAILQNDAPVCHRAFNWKEEKETWCRFFALSSSHLYAGYFKLANEEGNHEACY